MLTTTRRRLTTASVGSLGPLRRRLPTAGPLQSSCTTSFLGASLPRCDAVAHPVRSFHTTSVWLAEPPAPPPTPQAPQQQQQQPPTPSVEPVFAELMTIITRRYTVAEVFRALSPASRKILVAHKLPLEEFLLHLPNHFAVCRSQKQQRARSTPTTVEPAHLVSDTRYPLRLPPNAKPHPALAHLYQARKDGSSKASDRTSSGGGSAAASTMAGTGTGFVDSYATPLDRIQEVLTYVPNEWASFTMLGFTPDVKMRCMGYPEQKSSTFFLKHPKYFDIRLQSRSGASFEVRRSLALQKQLQEEERQRQKR